MATKKEETSKREYRPEISSHSSNPYSFENVVRLLSDNFGLLVMGVAIFIFGFVLGSLWTENKVLKAGGVANKGGGEAIDLNAQAPAPAQPLSDADWAEIQKDPVITIGEDDAPVTIVEFTDYQCPFCGQHYTNSHKQLVEKYVKTGKAKILLKDQALVFHPNANSAAQAVRCAEETGDGVAMHDQLFSNQAEWSNLSGDALYEKYGSYATTAGANGNTVVACVKENKYKAAVDEDGVLGNRVGAGGTPTFFVEKDPLVGAQPLAAFEAKIEEKLGGSANDSGFPGLPNAGGGN